MRHLEDQEQMALFEWAAIMAKRHPTLLTLFAIPNGGKRSKIEAGIMKACGVKAGVSDVCLPVACGDFGSLWIEMKAPGKRNRTTAKQKEWIALMEQMGNKAIVCDSWVEAQREICAYLNIKPN